MRLIFSARNSGMDALNKSKHNVVLSEIASAHLSVTSLIEISK